jgi:acetyl-CoA carboxylase biotin carboxyl carrier protein
MDIKEIKRIVELMKANELSEFELEEDNFRIAVKRKTGGDSQVVFSAPAAPAAPVAAAAPANPGGDAGGAGDEGIGLVEIVSPMVGTFYRSTAPDADPFADVGTSVTSDSIVCIIEAMKVMNEINAEVSGVIRKVLVENATPVEFGQPLFLVEPA